MTLGPICSTLAGAHGYQQAALGCALVLDRERASVNRPGLRVVRGWQTVYLADAHVLLCLVASSAPPSNEPRFGAEARSTPR